MKLYDNIKILNYQENSSKFQKRIRLLTSDSTLEHALLTSNIIINNKLLNIKIQITCIIYREERDMHQSHGSTRNKHRSHKSELLIIQLNNTHHLHKIKHT